MCLVSFLEHAQHSSDVQIIAEFINMRMPFQKTLSASARASRTSSVETLIPYIRRLIATGFDSPKILHNFFGSDWSDGIGAIHKTERRNYLLAAKSDTWLSVKANYDMDDGQTIPFLRPLQSVIEEELR